MSKTYFHDGSKFNQLSPDKIFEVSKSQEWYTEQGMMGYVWAKQNLDAMEQAYKKYAITDLQKYLWWQILNVPALYEDNNWWYWCNEMHKTFLSRFRFVIRRIDKLNAVEALRLYWNKGATMWKERFTKTLELLAWDYNSTLYFQNFPSYYRMLGMSKSDDWKRFKERHLAQSERENIPHFSEWKVKYHFDGQK